MRLLWGSGPLGIRNFSAFEHMKTLSFGMEFFCFRHRVNGVLTAPFICWSCISVLVQCVFLQPGSKKKVETIEC